jgi:hypothetical protein
MNKWIKVNGVKEMPIGNWLVKLEREWVGLDMVVAHIHPNISTVGGNFSFDMPKVIAYHELPEYN